MTPEKMMDAISGISDKYVEKYAVVEPVKHDRLNRMIIQRKWVYRLCAYLAVIAIAVGVPMLSNTVPQQYPFILTAYALDSDSTLIAQNLTDSIQIPVSLLETKDGAKGFLFSVDSANQSEVSSPLIYSAKSGEQMADGSCEIPNAHFESGKHYFFFVGQRIEDFVNVSFVCSDAEVGVTYEVTIDITEKDNGYFAELNRLNVFSTKN